MVANIRDKNTHAIVNPQYSLPSVFYSLYKHVYKLLQERPLPKTIAELKEKLGVTDERLRDQLLRLANLLDSLSTWKIPKKSREQDGYDYVQYVMEELNWFDSIDTEAQALIDTAVQSSLLTYFFGEMTDAGGYDDMRPQSAEALVRLVDNMMDLSVEKSKEFFKSSK